MPPVRFEPTISAGGRPQTYALDRAATGTGFYLQFFNKTYLVERKTYDVKSASKSLILTFNQTYFIK